MTTFAAMFGVPSRTKIIPELGSLGSLLAHLGMSSAELKKIWWYRGRMYKQFDIAKRGSKKRLIHAPNNRLKMLQRKIVILLDSLYQPRHGVHGFVRDRSIKTNAKAHLRSKHVVNLDIEKFFPTITEKRVIGLFEAIGLHSDVARALGRICCYDGALPQGAPTSPIIANMICFRLDKQLQALAKSARCIYTRYADDITLSSYQPPAMLFAAGIPPVGRVNLEALNANVAKAFSDNGFALNAGKTHYADKHSRRSVTGLRVNELINVDRRYIRNIRSALYRVEISGKASVQNELLSKYGNSAEIGAHIQGRVAWVGHIKGRADPTFRGLALRFNKTFPEMKLTLPPTPIEMRDRSVWLVEHEGNLGTQGTAFFLKSVGLITACHCVVGASDIEVYHPSKPSNRFKVNVAHIDARRDLAILAHDIPSTEFFELERSAGFTTGDPVMAAGYPDFGPGDEINIRTGNVASFSTKSLVSYVVVTQKLPQGMSGGPLLDVNNAVAGIIHKGGPDVDKDLAVHVDVLFEWISEIAVAK